jgi:large subunit ribosomal protein L10
MTKGEKAIIIDKLTEKFSNTSYYYITDASGLSVKQINAFRQMCYDKGVEYNVYKNTLVKKALQNVGTANEQLDEALKGFSGIIFTTEEGANLPAKTITEYRKKQGSKKPLLKAASIDSDVFLGEEHLKMLSELKTKAELVGEIIALLQSPAKNVVSALQSGKNILGGLLKTLEEREN